MRSRKVWIRNFFFPFFIVFQILILSDPITQTILVNQTIRLVFNLRVIQLNESIIDCHFQRTKHMPNMILCYNLSRSLCKEQILWQHSVHFGLRLLKIRSFFVYNECTKHTDMLAGKGPDMCVWTV